MPYDVELKTVIVRATRKSDLICVKASTPKGIYPKWLNINKMQNSVSRFLQIMILPKSGEYCKVRINGSIFCLNHLEDSAIIDLT